MDSPLLPPPLTPGAARLIKIRGWILVILGPLLCAGMAALTYFLAPIVNRGASNPTAAHWTGSHEMAVLMFELFGVIFLFGLMALAGGVSLLRRGRVPVVVIGLMVLCVLAMLGLGYQIEHSDPHREPNVRVFR